MFRHGGELWRVLNSCWQRQIKKMGWLPVPQSDLDEKMCRQLRLGESRVRAGPKWS